MLSPVLQASQWQGPGWPPLLPVGSPPAEVSQPILPKPRRNPVVERRVVTLIGARLALRIDGIRAMHVACAATDAAGANGWTVHGTAPVINQSPEALLLFFKIRQHRLHNRVRAGCVYPRHQ